MQVMKSARIAQADGMRFRNCVHDVFLSEGYKDLVTDMRLGYN